MDDDRVCKELRACCNWWADGAYTGDFKQFDLLAKSDDMNAIGAEGKPTSSKAGAEGCSGADAGASRSFADICLQKIL